MIAFDPRDSRCVECGAPFSQPPPRKQGGGATKIYCGPRCRANSWARGNTEKRAISVKKYDHKVESKEQKKARTRKGVLAKYGITEKEFQLRLWLQRFSCVGCCRPIDRENARIDHDHRTGEVRGLLCDHCNWAIGHVKEDIETLNRLSNYLLPYHGDESWKKFTTLEA